MTREPIRALIALQAATWLTLFASATPAAAQSGTARTVTLGPAAMVNTAPLAFGNIISGAGGTAIINAQTGLRTSTGVTLAGGTIGAARFVATGTPNRVVTLSLNPSPIVLRAGSATMTVNQLRISVNGGGPSPLGPNRNLGPLGIINLAIGGRLTIGANQTPGSYVGSFALTMDYQ